MFWSSTEKKSQRTNYTIQQCSYISQCRVNLWNCMHNDIYECFIMIFELSISLKICHVKN